MFRAMRKLLLLIALGAVTQASADVIDGEELVDPTKPLFYDSRRGDETVSELLRTVVPASFDISFIRAGSVDSVAVINNLRVSVGDVIGGAQVVAIDRGGVTLLIDDEERRISMYDSNIKSTPVGC